MGAFLFYLVTSVVFCVGITSIFSFALHYFSGHRISDLMAMYTGSTLTHLYSYLIYRMLGSIFFVLTLVVSVTIAVYILFKRKEEYQKYRLLYFVFSFILITPSFYMIVKSLL